MQHAPCPARLTVSVPVLPLAPHGPVGQDLEVVSAIHAVQPSQPPVIPQRAEVRSLILGRKHLPVRHPCPEETQLCSQQEGLPRSRVCCGEDNQRVRLPQRSGVSVHVSARRDHAGSWMRVPDSWPQPPTGIKLWSVIPDTLRRFSHYYYFVFFFLLAHLKTTKSLIKRGKKQHWNQCGESTAGPV